MIQFFIELVFVFEVSMLLCTQIIGTAQLKLCFISGQATNAKVAHGCNWERVPILAVRCQEIECSENGAVCLGA